MLMSIMSKAMSSHELRGVVLLLSLMALGTSWSIRAALAACGEDEWDCDNGNCIDSDLQCDGAADCADGTDEVAENCVHNQCPSFAFRCSYGGCIAGKDKCNGVRNCADGSDELPLLCSTAAQLEQLERQLRGNCSDDNTMQCSSGECLENDSRCDGHLDCRDGSDETLTLCSTTTCPSFAFRCGYGACIRGTAKCDGRLDCIDGSDEAATLCGQQRRRIQSNTTTTKAPSRVLRCQLPIDRPHLLAKTLNNRSLAAGARVSSAIVIFECERGYVMEGETRTFCNRGRWQVPIPKCSKYCSRQHLSDGISTDFVCYRDGVQVPCDERIAPGTEAHISCASGYAEPPPFRERIYPVLRCQESGEWDHAKYRCDMLCGMLAPQITVFARGGKEVNITQSPWHVGIYNNFDPMLYKHICGGTIISPKLIVSAAHCFWDAANERFTDERYFVVAAGKYYRDYYVSEEFPMQSRNVVRIHSESYEHLDRNYRNDIVILELSAPLRFTHSIRPICIQFLQRAQMQMGSGQEGRFAGWGIAGDSRQPSDRLLAVTMRTLSHADCGERLRDNANYELPDDKFCLHDEYGRSACRGDSGGGFITTERDVNERVYHLLRGVISHAPVKDQDCARDGIVAVTNVQYFRRLIDNLREVDRNVF